MASAPDEGVVACFDGPIGPVRYRRFHCNGAARGRVIGVHGVAEHGRRHAPFARAVARAGWEYAIADLRGHGGSAGRRGHVDDYEDYAGDLRAFAAHLAEAHPTSGPTFAYGHSMGGLILVRYLQGRPTDFAGVVLTAPLLRIAKHIPLWKWLAAWALERVVPHLALPTDVVPEELSDDPERNADFLADPEILRAVTLGWFHATRRAIRAAHADPRPLACPLLVLHGVADPVTSAAAAARFFVPPRAPHCDCVLLDGARHELLYDRGHEAAIARILTWLDAHAPS